MARRGYPDVLSYLDEVDPDLAEAYRACGLESLFSAKNAAGITFLRPSPANRSIVSQLLDQVHGEIEERTSVAKQLAALVIYDNLSSPDAFKSHASDIPNALRQHIPINMSKSTNNTIAFQSGCTAEIDPRFRDASERKNVTVYLLTGGLIGTSGPAATFAHVGAITGGGRRKRQEEPVVTKSTPLSVSAVDHTAIALRQKIAKETENQYMMDSIQRTSDIRSAEVGPVSTVYINKVLSLINFINTCCSKEVVNEVLVQRILPLLSFEHFDFYLIFEPAKTAGDYLVPQDIIVRWYNQSAPFSARQVLNKIESLMDSPSESKASVVSSRFQLQTTIDSDIRDDLVNITNKRLYAQQICELYTKLVATNSLGSCAQVFPEKLAYLYKTYPDSKIAQDEARYLAFKMFSSLERDQFEVSQFRSIIGTISQLLRDDADKSSLRLLNPNNLQVAINPQNKITEIATFINSKFFMYSPLSGSEMKKFGNEFEVSLRPCPNGEGLWFPTDKRVVVLHVEQTRGAYDESSLFTSPIEQALETLRAAGKTLDPQTKKALSDIAGAC